MQAVRWRHALVAALATLAPAGSGQDHPLADVPIRVVDGYVFIQASVNGSAPLTLLFDTGCTQFALHSATVDRLGLTVKPVTGHGGRAPFVQGVIQGASLAIGDLTLKSINAVQQDSRNLLRSQLGVEVDGVIGADLLRDFVVGIDYDRLRFTLWDSERFAYTGTGTGLDIVSTRFFATTTADLTLEDGEVLRGRFLIDTGAGVTVALNTPFVNRHDLMRRIGVEHIVYTLAAQSVDMRSHPGRIAHFNMGDRGFENLPILLSQTKAGPLSPTAIAGIIGNRLWRRFNTTFDYRRNKLYLEPNRFHSEPFQVDGSGLAIAPAAAGGFVVRSVFTGSPAARAGVQVGDVIVRIDGTDASTLAAHEARALLAQEGATVTLALDRRGEAVEVTLRLKSQY